MRSVEPPGGNVTMRRIGLAGKDSTASASLMQERPMAANIATMPTHFLRTQTRFIGDLDSWLKSKRGSVQARAKSAIGRCPALGRAGNGGLLKQKGCGRRS